MGRIPEIDSEAEYILAMADIMNDWQDMIEWLSYRHMVGYWLGLVRWRQGTYTYKGNISSPALRGAAPKSRRHGLVQRLLVRMLALGEDEDFYRMQCAAFRQVQRERRPAYAARVRQLEARYRGVIGGRLVRLGRKHVCECKGGLEVKKWFDRELEIEERHYEGNEKFEL
ncbi:hypothetical protein QQX98_008718 [Neonectria punicea]|uniref:Uncharacterized protein n=1 Tax=Neonectria punicea TaxID=979145 RepID=A0ABR1GUD5_9HYPO